MCVGEKGAEIVQKSLVMLTTDAILDYIDKNELEVGEKLPNEYDLATLLDVSRSTLRESVRILVSRNVLEVRRGSGTYISAKKGITDDPLGFSLTDNPLKMTEDLFELRYILEPYVASKAALSATPDEVAELKAIKEKIEMTVQEEGTKHFELDIQFHSIIARSSGNEAMNHLVPIINNSIWLYNDFYTSVESKQDMIESHEEIYSAIADGNSIAAHDAMSLHIAKIRQVLKEQQK